MKIQSALLLGAILIPGYALADKVDLGKQEYDNNCAVCHGVNGTGDGPLAGMIDTRVADLTTLSKSSNGVFPFNRVYEVIDGRRDVKGHGLRDMPVWGNEYNEKAIQYYTDFPRAYDPESFVRGRILALVGHIHGLQAE